MNYPHPNWRSLEERVEALHPDDWEAAEARERERMEREEYEDAARDAAR